MIKQKDVNHHIDMFKQLDELLSGLQCRNVFQNLFSLKDECAATVPVVVHPRIME